MTKGTPNFNIRNTDKMVALDDIWTLEIPENRKELMYLHHYYGHDMPSPCNYGGVWLDPYRLSFPNCSCRAVIPEKIYKKILVMEAARSQTLKMG